MTQYLPLLKLVFVGLVIGSLIGGGLALTAVALTFLIAFILLAARIDLPTALAVAIGILIVVFFPQFSLFAVDPVAALLCCVLILLV